MIENLVEILKSNLSEYHQTNENLAELIVDTEDQNMSSVLTSKENRDNELLKQKEQIFEKLKVASMKRSAAISKSRIEEYLKDPKLLVGKRIKYKVQEKKDSVPEWYNATVLKLEKLFNDPIRTEYELCYDIDGDEKFTFRLLRDLRKGSLVVVD